MPGLFQVESFRIASCHVGSLRVGSFYIGSFHVGSVRVRLFCIRAVQDRSFWVGLVRVRLFQVRLGPVGSVGSVQLGLYWVRYCQFWSDRVGSSWFGSVCVGLCHVGEFRLRWFG